VPEKWKNSKEHAKRNFSEGAEKRAKACRQRKIRTMSRKEGSIFSDQLGEKAEMPGEKGGKRVESGWKTSLKASFAGKTN
jgi:hypothetical protein